MRGVNIVVLAGNVGNEPEFRTFENGSVVRFSLATSRKVGKGEQAKDVTDWHNVVFWGKASEVIAKYVHKGSQIHVTGEIRYRSYTDKNNQTQYVTEIVGNDFQFLSAPNKQEDSTDNISGQNDSTDTKEPVIDKPVTTTGDSDDSEDILPF